MKTYIVTLELQAQSESQIDKWLDKMPLEMAEAIMQEKIVDSDEKHYEERIRYVEDWNGKGEHFIFEGKWSDEDKWGLDTAFKLWDYEGEKGVMIRYEALTKIRELLKMKIDFWFGRE